MEVPGEAAAGEDDDRGPVPTARPVAADAGGTAAPVVELAAEACATAPRASGEPALPPPLPPPAPRPAPRRRLRRLARVVWGCLLVTVSLVPLGAAAVHILQPGQLAWLPGAPAYWGIPSRLWSTVLVTLFLGLLIEGLVSIGRRSD